MSKASGGTSEQPDLNALTMGTVFRLEDLVDHESLREVVRSFCVLFGISMRVFSVEGRLLVDSVEQQALCQALNQVIEGRTACSSTVANVKQIAPTVDEQVIHTCFTGANYLVSSVSYDGRLVGKMILGPYMPVEVREVPATLLAAVPSLEPARARDLLPRMPRAKTETVRLIAEHMRSELDLILFSGHKALLTSEMHLASVRESYRELQEKNQRLQAAFDQLKELDRLKSNFIATVSHELRTPLTSIIGYGEMLGEGIAGELNPEQAEFVATIREKGEQLLTLITGMLDLSKLESGKQPLQKIDINLLGLFKDIVHSLTPAAQKKTISIDVQVGRTLSARADSSKLRQALIHIVDNAIKFTPSGGTIAISAREIVDESPAGDAIGFALLSPAHARVEVRIADTGIGIPEQERGKVFDAFYQVDSSSTREYGGAGVGLAIVKGLVESHDGKVWIEDNVPAGTVVVMSLPGTPPGT